jgi:hypothetical protein
MVLVSWLLRNEVMDGVMGCSLSCFRCLTYTFLWPAWSRGRVFSMMNLFLAPRRGRRHRHGVVQGTASSRLGEQR